MVRPYHARSIGLGKKRWILQSKEVWMGKQRKTWLTEPAPNSRFKTKKDAEKMMKQSKKSDLHDPSIKAGRRKYIYRIKQTKN